MLVILATLMAFRERLCRGEAVWLSVLEWVFPSLDSDTGNPCPPFLSWSRQPGQDRDDRCF